MRYFLILFTFLFFLFSCDLPTENEEESQDSLTQLQTVEDFEELEKQIKSEEETIEEKREERNQQGDTIAIDDETLKSYLPKKINNYQLNGQPVGSPYQASGTSFSSTEQNYIDGNNQLRVTLTDYNAANTQHAQSIAMWRSGLRIDNRRELAGSFEIEDMIGWEIYHKRERRSEIMLAVSDRILISIIANNQEDTEYIKEIVQKINLKRLSKF